ncbi:MAG: hypothetical protein ABI891_16280 [Acidobacteriota bacterium]
MKKVSQIHEFFASKTIKMFLLLAVVITSASVALFPLASTSDASAPSSGTLNSTGPNVTWDGDKVGGAAANGEADCAGTVPGVPSTVCDEFALTIGGTVGNWTNKHARVQINWAAVAYDYDMYIYKGTPASGNVVATSANGTTTFEQADIDPSSTGVGLYTVRVVYFVAATPLGQSDPNQYHGIASAVDVSPPFSPPPSTCQIPSYSRHNPPTSLAGYNDAGEPSIGINWNTGNVLFQAYIYTLRATFDDATSPATASWNSFNPANQPTSLDPIMFTDPTTGRTIPGQLIAAGGTSLTAITDNDGDSFTPNVTTGVTSGVDHQTIGAGPYNRNPITNLGLPGVQVGPTTSYPNAWYYASQDVGAATATRSDDGGVSYFIPAVPMYNLVQCSGLHGHVKIAPDGTVYVPNKNCPDPDMNAATLDGGQGFAVSEDNGITWSVRTLPGSGSGDNDPAVGIGAGGRVFFVYTSSDKHIRAAVSDDKGRTWKYDQDLGLSTSTPNGQPYNIKASVFPAAVGGDNNRAALFFHGTDSTMGGDPTGDDSGATPFAGTWYPYVATTCDGGMSWSVVRADDAVQQGVICTSGTTCPSGTRNLLDFMDIKVDRFGRAVPGYADGCLTQSCLNAVNGTKDVNDKTQVATILRQIGGSRLFSDFDAGGPAAPSLPPPVAVTSSAKANQLSWETPDDNGSPLTGYRIYRGNGEGNPILIGEVNANVHSFRDKKVRRNSVYYQVTAVNNYGESPRTRKFYANNPSKIVRGE